MVSRVAYWGRANAVALVALFVALGGSSYAAVTLAAGSVGTVQLRNRAVTLDKIAPSAVCWTCLVAVVGLVLVRGRVGVGEHAHALTSATNDESEVNGTLVAP